MGYSAHALPDFKLEILTPIFYSFSTCTPSPTPQITITFDLTFEPVFFTLGRMKLFKCIKKNLKMV